MTKTEIIQKIANIHNSISQVMVSGDNAIAVAGALIDMRQLVSDLQADAQEEAQQDEPQEETE